MKYTFFGTPEFSKIVLEKLIESDFAPGLVVCNPDSPVGRNRAITPPPTKVLAQEHGISTYQPDKLSLDEFKRKARDSEFAVLAAYGKIIPKEILDYFSKGVIGVHPSLLPEYRGPTPIRSAMLDGLQTTGVTLFLTEEGVDDGPIISQREVEIGNLTYIELKKKLAKVGADMVVEDVPDYLDGKIDLEEQDKSKAIHTGFFQTSDAEVEYNDLIDAIEGDKEKSEIIDRKIKALNPEPGIWTKTDENQILSLPKNKRVKLLESHLENGILVLDKIHVAGKSKPRKV